jgi:hypothetical protein
VVLLLVRRGTVPARATYLGVAGCAALAVGSVLSLVWALTLPMLVHQGVFDLAGPGIMLFGVVQTAVHAVGLGLLVAAVVTSGRPTAPTSEPGSQRQVSV